MANLKNTIINDTGYIKFPTGTQAERSDLSITIRGLWNNSLGIAENGLQLYIDGNGNPMG